MSTAADRPPARPPSALILRGDSRRIPLADGSVHGVVTSPPYYSLRAYDGVNPSRWPPVDYCPMPGLPPIHVEPMTCCLGLEPDVIAYVGHLSLIFREIRRVLRDDGAVWLNLGDSYAAKNLLGVPWRVALALQADQPRPRIMSNDVDRSWLAAMVDGEGSIGIRRQNSWSNGGSGQRCRDGFTPILSIGNNDRELLDHCVRITGVGRVRIKSRQTPDPRQVNPRKTHYCWRLDGNKAVDVVSEIYPFLIAKRRQAILLETLDRSNKYGRSIRGRSQLPAEEQEKREILKTLIHRCNQREPVDMPPWCVEPEWRPKMEPGWFIRSAPPWVKHGSAMPESTKDRPGTSHESLFMLTKQTHYHFDMDSVRRPHTMRPQRRPSGRPIDETPRPDGHPRQSWPTAARDEVGYDGNPAGRNLRTSDFFRDSLDSAIAWHLDRIDHLERCRRKGGLVEGEDGEIAGVMVNPEAYKGSHYAVMPCKLIEVLIKCSVPEKVCSGCGAPWERVVERETRNMSNAALAGTRIVGKGHPSSQVRDGHDIRNGPTSFTRTLGFRPTCPCPSGTPAARALLLDPFGGVGSTGVSALALGRNYLGVEPSEQYCLASHRRIARPHAPPARPPSAREPDLPLFRWAGEGEGA
jgi:hypothetical protein